MSRHEHKVGKRTLIYYDTKEEIGGNPSQSKLVPEGYEPMSGNYMVISPFNANPWVVSQPQPDFSHPGEAWRLVYASGGYKDKEIYSSREPDFRNAVNPSTSSRTANQRLERESDRHIGDISSVQILEQMENNLDRKKLSTAVDDFNNVGYNLIFYEHSLNRPTIDENDPVSICFGVKELPARDRNSSDSERESIRKWETLRTFIESPMHVMTQMERGSVKDGFCLSELHGTSHSPITERRNRSNCVGMGAQN